MIYFYQLKVVIEFSNFFHFFQLMGMRRMWEIDCDYNGKAIGGAGNGMVHKEHKG